MNNDQALAIINKHPERAQMFADMLACFKAFNLRIVGSIHDAILVQKITFPYGDIFAVCDNGGEINVEHVNHGSLRSFPYSTTDGATLAYRVRCGVDGDAVDFSLNYASDLEVLKAFGG